MIDLQIDVPELPSVVLASPVLRQSVADGLNETLRKARKLGVENITSRVNLPSRYVSDRVQARQATANKLEGRIEARKRGTRLDRYPYSARKNGARSAGVDVNITRGTGSLRLYSAFLVRARRGNEAGAGGMAIAMRKSVAAKLGAGTAADRIDWEQATGKRGREYVVLHALSVEAEFRSVVPAIAPEVERVLQQEVEQKLSAAGAAKP